MRSMCVICFCLNTIVIKFIHSSEGGKEVFLTQRGHNEERMEGKKETQRQKYKREGRKGQSLTRKKQGRKGRKERKCRLTERRK